MPYKIVKRGSKHCVVKKDGSKTFGCHATRGEAESQMAAIHANEGKKDSLFRTVAEVLRKAMGMDDQLPEHSENDQEQNELKAMVWKETGPDGEVKYRWLARYSNNFRDDDPRGREIITEASHRRFADMVDKGLVPSPTLWVWHEPQWKIGKATWVAYDDSGFALAAGDIDKDKHDIAEWLSQQEDIAVSHGMPPSTVKRKADDPSIIVEHVTEEISIVPRKFAANKMTDFIMLSKEDEMSIPETKRAELVKSWGMSPDLLARLEQKNAMDAQKAVEEGLERKDSLEAEVAETVVSADAAVPAETAPEEPVEAAPAEETEVANEQKDADMLAQPPSREEVADAVVAVISPFIERLEQLEATNQQLVKGIEALSKSDEAKVAKAVADSTPASVSALLAQRLSIVGNETTRVDGRSSLAKSKPHEAEEVPVQRTGIEFLDKMLSE